MEWLLVLLVVAAALAEAWRRLRRGASRQRRLMLLCDRAGLAFEPVDLHVDTAWLPFPMFGSARHGTENVVWDRNEGDDVRAFDFWYQEETDERPLGNRHRLTCAVVPLRSSCPRLRVVPRDLASDLGALGHEVHLELDAFEHRFRVEADDPRFAVAFLDQRLMEAFLALPDDVSAEVHEDTMLLWAPVMPAERVLVLVDTALEMRRRIPRVVSSLFPPRPVRGSHEVRWMQGHWSAEATGGPA
jgi:hypothetical protein